MKSDANIMSVIENIHSMIAFIFNHDSKMSHILNQYLCTTPSLSLHTHIHTHTYVYTVYKDRILFVLTTMPHLLMGMISLSIFM